MILRILVVIALLWFLVPRFGPAVTDFFSQWHVTQSDQNPARPVRCPPHVVLQLRVPRDKDRYSTWTLERSNRDCRNSGA